LDANIPRIFAESHSHRRERIANVFLMDIM